MNSSDWQKTKLAASRKQLQQQQQGGKRSNSNSPSRRGKSTEAWSLPYHPSQQNEKTDVPSAEPQHRIGAQGVSSGISLRDFPKSNVQQVREICLHYTKKCSGKYQDNKMAARYVHQMADEIIKQLTGVSSQIKRFEDDPAVYQALLDEWNENFPASLYEGSKCSPRAIAQKLADQSAQIARLQFELKEMEEGRRNDTTALVSSLDVQAQASKISILAERSEFKKVLLGVQRECEEDINAIRADCQDKLDELVARNNAEVRALKAKIDEVENLRALDRRNFEKEVEGINQAGAAAIELLKRGFATEKKELKDKISSLESKLKHMSITVADLTSKAQRGAGQSGMYNFSALQAAEEEDAESIDLDVDNNPIEDLESVASESEDESESEEEIEVEEEVKVMEEVTDDESDEEASVSTKSSKASTTSSKSRTDPEEERERQKLLGILDSAGDSGRVKPKKMREVTKLVKVMKKVKKEKKDHKEKSKSKKGSRPANKLMLSGPIGKAIKGLKETIARLTKEQEASAKLLAAAADQRRTLEEVNNKYFRELQAMRTMNETLRSAVEASAQQSALAEKLGENYDASKSLSFHPYVLHHTPHFLGHPRFSYETAINNQNINSNISNYNNQQYSNKCKTSKSASKPEMKSRISGYKQGGIF